MNQTAWAYKGVTVIPLRLYVEAGHRPSIDRWSEGYVWRVVLSIGDRYAKTKAEAKRLIEAHA